MNDGSPDHKAFDFWNDHSLEFLEMAMMRDHQEVVSSPDGYGRRQRACGDVVEFFLTAPKGLLAYISYDLRGCLFSHACANTVIRLALNKTVDQARAIREQDIIGFLKTLPKKEEHCAEHVLNAFRDALFDLENKTDQDSARR